MKTLVLLLLVLLGVYSNPSLTCASSDTGCLERERAQEREEWKRRSYSENMEHLDKQMSKA